MSSVARNFSLWSTGAKGFYNIRLLKNSMVPCSAACRSMDCLVNAVAEKWYCCPAVERATYVGHPASTTATGLRYPFCAMLFCTFRQAVLSSITALPIMNLFQKMNKCFQLLLSFRPVRSRVVGSSSFSGPLVGCSSCCRNQFKYHVPLCQIKAPSPVPLINFPKGVTSC